MGHTVEALTEQENIALQELEDVTSTAFGNGNSDGEERQNRMSAREWVSIDNLLNGSALPSDEEIIKVIRPAAEDNEDDDATPPAPSARPWLP